MFINFFHKNNLNFKSFYPQLNTNYTKGFTLAEVLITLGIIGIIAESTIPTLINNVHEIQYQAAAKKAFSESLQAVNAMKDDQGGDLTYYYTNTRTFYPEFKSYFKIMKDCGYNDCIPTSGNSKIYKSMTDAPFNTYYMDDGEFYTTDGMFFAIENPSVGINNSYVWIFVDVNGYDKKPNTLGRDVFAFEMTNNHLIPMGADDSKFPASQYCNKNGESSLFQGIGCMAYVMEGINYKI